MSQRIPEEIVIGGALAIFFTFVGLLFLRPETFRPILEIHPSKMLIGIGLLLNLVGSIAIATDLLTPDTLYLKRHRMPLDVLFMSFFALPYLYLFIHAVVHTSLWMIVTMLAFFLAVGGAVRFGSEWFEHAAFTKYGQSRAMAFLGTFLLIAGFACQFVAVFLG